jgi:hypothetical protein
MGNERLNASDGAFGESKFLSLRVGPASLELPPAEPCSGFSVRMAILLIRQIDRACRSRENSDEQRT